MKKIVLFLLITATLLFVVPQTLGDDKSESFVVQSVPHASVTLVRSGNRLQYYSLIISVNYCVNWLDCKEVILYNAKDTSFVKALFVSQSIKLDSDSCLVENSIFNIHGGRLRSMIEKDGLLQIVARGPMHTMITTLTEIGEKNTLSFMIPKSDST